MVQAFVNLSMVHDRKKVNECLCVSRQFQLADLY